ncbi:MAG: hypothetical protein ACLPX7_03745 [Xanthobacteraceae bacterium]
MTVKRIIRTAHAGPPLSRPRPGWPGQEPAAWWQTTDTLDELKSAHFAARPYFDKLGDGGTINSICAEVLAKFGEREAAA